MRGGEFKKRALQEGLRYGEDRMVFIREFAQNSRDAGARQIGIVTDFIEGQFVLTFGDNGTGMNYDHARQFLFTLYASSKEDEASSAGRFGVGFWSALLFEPTIIEIESRAEQGNTWKVILDGDLSKPRTTDCHLKANGTRITLRKTVGNSYEAKHLLRKVERAILRYCRFLNQTGKAALPLPIFLNGKWITETVSLEGPWWMTFSKGTVNGVVGLGQHPRVELYARGLLVWTGTLLNELRYGATSVKPMRHSPGLAPIYLINGDNLNVTLNRRAVIDDQALEMVRLEARRHMREALRLSLDRICDRPLGEKIRDRLGGWMEDIRLGKRLPLLIFIALIIIALVIGPFLLAHVKEQPQRGDTLESSRSSPITNPTSFTGPRVDIPKESDGVSLRYHPPIVLLFRTGAYDQLDGSRGIIGNVPRSFGDAPVRHCKTDCVDVEVDVNAGTGPLLVPVPTGYVVEPHSLMLNGKPLGTLKLSQAGEPLLDVKNPIRGVLKYRVGPAPADLNRAYKTALLDLPPTMTFPQEFNRIISTATRGSSPSATVNLLRSFVEKRIAYSISDTTRTAYNRYISSNPRGGWLDFVLAFGQGDCDVKNTVLVALLRSAHIPARLAIGVVGRQGKTIGGYHAWVEYYVNNSWRHADATGSSPAEASRKPLRPEHPLQVRDRSSLPTMADNNAPFESTQPPRSSPGNSLPMILAIIAAAIAALFAVYGLILLLKGQRKHTFFSPKDQEEQVQMAADMLINVLAHPEAWLKSGGVSRRKLIPVLGKKRAISLDHALALSRAGSLWMSNGESDLASQASERGTIVLDASDPLFGPLVTRLPGIVDLDEIASLQPIEKETIPDDQSHLVRLVDNVNDVLCQAGLPAQTVMLSEGATGAAIRDVDLGHLGLPRFSHWPTRFISVKMEWSTLLECAALARKEPSLATFLFIDMLLDESALLSSHHQRIRELAARFALEGAA